MNSFHCDMAQPRERPAVFLGSSQYFEYPFLDLWLWIRRDSPCLTWLSCTFILFQDELAALDSIQVCSCALNDHRKIQFLWQPFNVAYSALVLGLESRKALYLTVKTIFITPAFPRSNLGKQYPRTSSALDPLVRSHPTLRHISNRRQYINNCIIITVTYDLRAFGVNSNKFLQIGERVSTVCCPPMSDVMKHK